MTANWKVQKLGFWWLVVLLILWASVAWAQAGALPGPTADGALPGPSSLDPKILLDTGNEVINLAKTGQWLLFSFLVIKAIWGLLEYAPVKKKLGEYGMELNILFGAVAAALALVVGGASWMEAGIVFFTGPGADVVHDLLAILWKKKLKADAEAKTLAGGG